MSDALPAGLTIDRMTRDDAATLESWAASEGWNPGLHDVSVAWDYDPEMDIFAVDEGTGATRRLTTARGYDAEASYSPDGSRIVFSSMRDTYNRTLDERERKALEENPTLKELEQHDPKVKELLAVARRRGLKPYRYPRQRYNTVMVRLTEVHMNEVWSEFQELDRALRQHLDSVAERVISEAISNDTSEATEVAGELE